MAASSLTFFDIDKRKIIVLEDGSGRPHFAIHGIIRIQILTAFAFSCHFWKQRTHKFGLDIFRLNRYEDSKALCLFSTPHYNHRAVGEGRNISVIGDQETVRSA